MTESNLRLLADCEYEIKNILQWIGKNRFHSNIKYLVSYAIIKASGTIEIVFKTIIYDFLSENATKEAKQFLSSKILDSSCNPSTQKISAIINGFDGKKSKDFDKKLKNTQEKSDLNSLVSLRNDLAHGGTVNVTINTVYKYFVSGKTVIEWLEDIIQKQ